MCGRFALYSSFQAIKEYYELLSDLELIENFNVTPGSLTPVIIRENQITSCELFHWGLVPFWAKDIKIGYKLINARAESIAKKASFKHAFLKRRCLIPVNGFYEWDKTSREPYFIFLKNRKIFSLAGIWEQWKNSDNTIYKSFSIITTQANEKMKDIHYRMPAIIPSGEEKNWLKNTNSASKLLTPYEGNDFMMLDLPDKVNSQSSNEIIKRNIIY